MAILRRSRQPKDAAVEAPKLDQELGSSRGVRIVDLVPKLNTRALAIQTYDQMAKTDAVTSVSLRASKAPVTGADFYFEPATDDQQGRDIAEFVEYNITKSVTSPFTTTLGKICKNYQHGTSIFEDVWSEGNWRPSRSGANSKSYTLLKKLAYRPTGTIIDIETDDNGGPVQVLQNALDAKGRSKKVPIPIEKALIFPIGDADDLFGDSLLRGAYPHWYYKNYLYKIDAIQKERHGIGIPRGILPPGYRPADKALLIEMVKNLRTNEKAEVVYPQGYDINFIKPEGQLVDVLKSAGTHDVLILMNTMAQFMMLGLESSGSGGGRATGAAQLDIFYKSLWNIANAICAAYNLYLIPKIVQYNFGVDQYPIMKVRNIGQTRDLQQLAAALGNLADKDLVTPDMITEQWVREVFDMPRKMEDRPEVSGASIRELITKSIQANGVSTGNGSTGNVSTTGVQGGGSNGASATQV